MFGCLGRFGCLLMLALLVAAGWFTRSWWYPALRHRVLPASAETVLWTPITPEAAQRGARAAARLSEKSGPVYATLTPAEFAAWQLEPTLKALDDASARAEAAAHGDTLFVRAQVAVNELGDPKTLGPLAEMLDGRHPVVMGGRLAMDGQKHISLQVTTLTVNDLRLPLRLTARIISRMSDDPSVDSIARGVVTIPAPKGVADVRVTNGKVILYKAVK